MMDPYAPKGWPRDTAPETRSKKHDFELRLRQLGATDEEIAETVGVWGDDPEDDERLFNLNDIQLRGEIVSVRTEYQHDTTEAAPDELRVEAADRIGGTINEIMEWVGTDRSKAAAVLRLEPADGRKTLIMRLGKV